MSRRDTPMNRVDGALFGECVGFVWRVFYAPWWRVDRWVHFWLFEKRARGVIEVEARDGKIDRYWVVRHSEISLPNVVGRGTAKPKRGTIYR